MSTDARRVGRNMAALTAAQLVSRLLAGLSAIYLARVLTPDYFGIITLALSLLMYAELLVDAGLRRLGAREVVRHTTPVATLGRAILSLRLLLALAAFALFALFAWAWQTTAEVQWVLLIYALSLFAAAFDFSWLFLGQERMHVVALADVVTQAALVGGILLLVRGPEQLLLVPIIYLVAKTAGVALLVRGYRAAAGSLSFGLEQQVVRPLLRTTIPLGLVAFLSLTTYNFDLLLIGYLLGTHAAGIYGAAYRIVALPAMLASTYFAALLPALDRTYQEGTNTLRPLLDKSVRLTAVAGVGLGVAGTLLAEPGFALLYGDLYADSVLPFQILIWSVTLLLFNRNYRALLASYDHERIQLLVVAAAAGVNVTLNLLLIPSYGLAGAAVTTVFSEFLTLLLSYLFARRLIGHVPFWRHLLRLAPAGLLLALVLWWSAPLPLLLRIALGTAVYLPAVLLLRLVSPAEIQTLLTLWRPGRKVAQPAPNKP